MGIGLRQFRKEAEHPETRAEFVRVVEQHDGVGRELRTPALEIVAHRFVGVQSIDMQQVDRAILERAQRFVEGHAQQRREGAERGGIETAQVLVDVFAVIAGMLIAALGIDREGAGREAECAETLAEGGIGHAAMSAEFDEKPGPQSHRQPEGEGNVADPGAFRPQA